jgi:glycosyltransferase involved in cell wall biosynthesis
MTEFPLVSIVIPVFNGANYVGDAIESALAQNYPNLEVIVVNDGSNDGGATEEAVRQFEPHVRSIQKPNGGVATALNAGISAMRGELFSWLSHDDLYKPDKVSRQVEVFRGFGARCVVIGDFELMNERGQSIDQISLAGRNLAARPLDAIFHGLINGCALLVPKYLFREVGTFEPGLPTTQDYHLWHRIARSTPFVHCPHADVRQRVHPLQGSRHASHLDEASRLVIHLIDSTPFEVMRAYEGSPMRFLMKVRERLLSYRGLHAYLDLRIDQLLHQLPYSVVFCPGATSHAPERSEQVRRMQSPPAEVVYSEIDANDALLPIVQQVQAAWCETSVETVVFLPAGKPPVETEILSALRRFIQTDSDIARPKQSLNGSPALAHVVARRSALPILAEAFSGETSGWAAIPPYVRVTEYSMPDATVEVAGDLPNVFRDEVPTPAIEPLAHTFRRAKERTSSLVRSIRIGENPLRIEAALRGQSPLSFSRSTSDRAVDRALTAMQKLGLPTLFFLSHGTEGNSNRHLAEMIRALQGRANCIVGLGQRGGELHLCAGSTGAQGGVVFHLPNDLNALVHILHRAGVSRTDVHDTFEFDDEARSLLDSLGLPFDVTLGEPAIPLPILKKAERVIALSRDMGARMRKLYPDIPVVVARHWDDSSASRVRHVFVPRLWGNEPLRIIVVGRMKESQGYGLIRDAARLASKRKLPIRFHILGDVDSSTEGYKDGIDALTIHGRFDSENFSARLGAIAPHLAWVPTQVPETWSYALTDLMDSALPLAACSIGAIPERCFGRPATWLLPWETTAEAWVEMFLKLHGTQLEEPPQWSSIEHLPPVEMIYFDDYLRPPRS